MDLNVYLFNENATLKTVLFSVETVLKTEKADPQADLEHAN